jgi:hypothetical protein
MNDGSASNQIQPIDVAVSENQKGIENHRTAAGHLESAAKFHLEAAQHHQAGEHEKAARSTLKAQGFFSLASEAQKQDVKHHALDK